MNNLKNLDKLELCPYNPSHDIRSRCLSQHLIKCRRNYPNQKLVTCDFNSTHRIPEPELQYHYQICENRKNLELPVVGAMESNASKFPINNDVTVSETESWDSVQSNSYNPQEYVETNHVIQNLSVQSKSERRQFRIQERHRLSNLNNPMPTENRGGVDRQRKFVNLPPERSRTEVPSEVIIDKTEMIKEAIKLGGKKVYMQHEKQNNE